jgi:hypothetical protein
MDTDKVLLIIGLVLLLFFIMRNVSYHTVYTTSTPVTTKSATVIYRTPQVSSVYVNPGHYNAYKAQYYN